MPSKPGISISKKTISFWNLSERRLSPSLKVTISRTFTSFFPSHRSYIVNMAMVTSFDHELIYLCDGQFTAYLTRRKFTEFKRAYLMFMESKR